MSLHNLLHGSVLISPGLHKREGVWARVKWLTVEIDPLTRTMPGASALVTHEMAHVVQQHAIWSLLFAWTPVVGWAIWPFFRRQAEIWADRKAFEYHGLGEFRSFVHMHAHPSTRWGRWLYGETAVARMERVGAIDRPRG